MNNCKNQNSILVLATLGVYLGLVLAGATPQVLAQAAMTRQFDVKDEIEVKDDLDKKPNRPVNDPAEIASSETDNKISRSVQRFLAEFKTIDSAVPFCSSSYIGIERKLLLPRYETSFFYERIHEHTASDQIITVTNLPRAGLDSLLATDAK